MSFFVKACVEALKAFPSVNGRIDGADIVYHNYYDIGVAVSTEKGLMVPIVRDCDRLSFAGIEKAIAGLAQKAREEKITLADLQGGTFTITNGGIFGSLLSTPILNPPQSAILGMHAIQKRPVAIDEQVVIRPMMYLALSYDHRIIDGREAVQFPGARQGVHREPGTAAAGNLTFSPLSPVLGGEGLGVRGRSRAKGLSLPPHPRPLSPEYRGEGRKNGPSP